MRSTHIPWRHGAAHRAAMSAAVLLMLTACGGGSSSDQAPPPVAAITMSLGTDSASVPWNERSPIKVMGNDSASQGTLTLVSATPPTHGRALLVDGQIEYQPDEGYVGSDSFSYTVRAADGGTASAEVKLKVQAALTLQGVVSDGPIANAAVTATVSGQSYSATADAQGAYSVRVLADSLADTVLLSATGVAAQSQVKLQSLASDMAALAAVADTNGTVTASQSTATSISHYSTALKALVLKANGQQAPTSSAQLAELTRQVSAEELMNMATTIKLVVDKGVALPAGVADTLALVEGNAAAWSTLFAAQMSRNESLVNATLAEVANGNAQALPVMPAGRYVYFSSAIGSLAITVADYRANGQATALGTTGTREGSWTQQAGQVELIYQTPYSYSAYTASFPQESVRYDYLGLRALHLIGGAEAGVARLSTHSKETTTSGPSNGQVTYDSWDAFTSSFARMDQLPAMRADMLRVGARYGGVSTLGSDPNGEGAADIMEVTGAASARLLRSGTELSWRVQAGELFIKSGTTERSYRELINDPGLGGRHMLSIDHQDGKPTRAGRDFFIEQEAGAVFKPDASLFDKRWKHGFTEQFYVFSSDGSGKILTAQGNGTEAATPFIWQVTASGALRMLRPSGTRVRDWILLRRVGERMVVLEGLGSEANADPTNWRINTFTASP